MEVTLIALCLRDFVIPCGFYRWSLTTMAQDIPFHEIPLISDCCNHRGSCFLVNPYLIIKAGMAPQVSMRQLAVSPLSKGISSTLNFHQSIRTDGTRTYNLLHQKRGLYQLS